MWTGLSSPPEPNSRPVSQHGLPVYPPSGHLLLGPAGMGRKPEGRECHPRFTDLWSLGNHRAAAAFPRWSDRTPGEEGVLLWGQETRAQSLEGVLRAPDMEVSSRSLGAHWGLCRWCLAGWGVWPSQAKLPAPGVKADSSASSLLLLAQLRVSTRDPYLWRCSGGAE